MCRNYTGDVLNFGLAKEEYAARHPDKADRVKFVIVGDDVAVGRTQGSIVGRRYGHLSKFHYIT
jgi:dihydroxyacetone kinase